MSTVSLVISTKQSATSSTLPTAGLMYDPFNQGYGGGHEVFQYGVQPTHIGMYSSLYYLADHEVTYRTCRQILKMYHFREGLEFTNQNKYQETVRKLRKFFDNVNRNRQTLLEVLFEIEDDFNIADDVYLCANRNYVVDKHTGDIITSEIKELFRGSPIFYRLVSKDNTRLGGVYGRCLVCEAERYESFEQYNQIQDFAMRYNRQVSPNVVFYYRDCKYDKTKESYLCPICGCKLHDVTATVLKSADSTEPIFFHIKKEVIHASKYSPSLLYGTAPLITVYNQVDTKIKFGQYIQSFLDYNRAPQGAIFINTGNADQVKKTIAQASMKYAVDRYYMPIIAIDSQSNGTIAQYIQLTPFPEELKQLQIENGLRREIAALLGVQNVMLNDLEGVGGLNSESLQVQVTDRAALAGQIVYNTKLFPHLMEWLSEYGQFDIGEDLSLIVKRTDNAENEIRMVNLERSMNLAITIMEMGYEVEPDFANLLGYDNKKMLPFNFRKLSDAEIRARNQLEVETQIDDKPPKVPSPSQPTRSKIPGFRTKQLLNRRDDPFGTEVMKEYEEDKKGNLIQVNKLYYKVKFSDYEYGYVPFDYWERLVKVRSSIDEMIEKRAKEQEEFERISSFISRSSPELKKVLICASALRNADLEEKGKDIPFSLEGYISKSIEMVVSGSYHFTLN